MQSSITRITNNEIYAIAAAALALLLVALWILTKTSGKGHLSSIVIGKDNRTSTSKVGIALWTLLIVWAILAFVIAGEFVKIHSCAAASTDAVTKCKADPLGLMQLSWRKFLAGGLAQGYLVLLGLPATAAVAAKGITQSKDASKTSPKTQAKAASSNQPAKRIAQIFSDDDGNTDIGDLQYMMFTTVLAIYFVAEFVQPNGLGLPAIPSTLLGLTSVSGALYVAKKAVAQDQPAITSVSPEALAAGDTFTISGTNLTATSDQYEELDGLVVPKVEVNGVAAIDVNADADTGQITAKVPPSVEKATKVRVETAFQVKTPAYALSGQ